MSFTSSEGLLQRHKGVFLAPSLLSADILNLKQEVLEVESLGCDLHHIDVMDSHFVPPLTFGASLVAALKKVTSCPLDVHLMVSDPEKVITDYIEAGASMLSFHYEATVHHHRLIQQITSHGVWAGVALNPSTPVEMVFPLLEDLKFVLLMSVNPGWGGQKFIPSTIEKCRHLFDELKKRGLQDQVLIEVDGGIHPGTIKSMAEAGARIFVAGASVYGSEDRKKALQDLGEGAGFFSC